MGRHSKVGHHEQWPHGDGQAQSMFLHLLATQEAAETQEARSLTCQIVQRPGSLATPKSGSRGGGGRGLEDLQIRGEDFRDEGCWTRRKDSPKIKEMRVFKNCLAN